MAFLLAGLSAVLKKAIEVAEESSAVGSALIQLLGLIPCEETRVGIAGLNSIRFTTAMHALIRYSMVMVPLYHNSKLDALASVLFSPAESLQGDHRELRSSCGFLRRLGPGGGLRAESTGRPRPVS